MADVTSSQEAAGIELNPGQSVEKRDKEGMFRAIAEILSRGYALPSAEISSIAEAYGVDPGAAPRMIDTKAAQQIMSEAGILPVTRNHKGSKMWIDLNGATRPEEIRRVKKAFDVKKRNSGFAAHRTKQIKQNNN